MANSTFDLFSSAQKSSVQYREPLTVTQVNQRARNILEQSLSTVSVVGEVSNFKMVSGHSYFVIKDSSSQLPAVLFRREASRLKFDLKQGMEVVINGKLTVYLPYGRYQIVADSVEPKGAGALQVAFEQLKEKLEREGLFDIRQKRPLSLLNRRVAVVTSLSGAVIRDIIHVATRRFPNAQILVVPSKVQGSESASSIVAGVRKVSELSSKLGLDALIVGRGGGSMEDLWGYNAEDVARAISECSIPVVSAVGHETDFTIADFVADKRAPTPSAAAEILFPLRSDLFRRLNTLLERQLQSIRRAMGYQRERIRTVGRLMGDGRAWLREYQQRLSYGNERIRLGANQKLIRYRLQLQQLEIRLGRLHPNVHLNDTRLRVSGFEERFVLQGRQYLANRRQKLGIIAGRLHALSPLGVLERGYSITLTEDGQVVRTLEQVNLGDPVAIRIAGGQITARIEKINA